MGKESGQTEHGLGESVVLELTQQYRNNAHRIFCDNFFPSPHLFCELYTQGLYGTCTLTQERFPRRVPGLSAEDSAVRQSGSLSAVVWQDKSTFSSHYPSRVRQKNGSLAGLPSAIATYKQYIGGVNLGNQLRKFSVRLKCNKNYKYIFWFMFDVCITKAFILSMSVPSSLTSVDQARLKCFRVQLAKPLVGDYNSRHDLSTA